MPANKLVVVKLLPPKSGLTSISARRSAFSIGTSRPARSTKGARSFQRQIRAVSGARGSDSMTSSQTSQNGQTADSRKVRWKSERVFVAASAMPHLPNVR